MRHAAAGGPQLLDQGADLAESGFERFERGKLAADVHRDSAHFEPVFPCEACIDIGRAIEWDTELVLAFARRDLLMRAGIDIGVYPQRAGRALAMSLRDGSKLVAFFLALDIELADPGFETLQQFGMCLADARKDDVFRLHPGLQRAGQFTARDDIRTIAFAGEDAQHRKIGIGLHCEGDVRIVQRAQCVAKHACVAGQRGARIDIDGRADFLGNAPQRNVFGVQYAVLELEMVHGRPLPKPSGLVEQALLARLKSLRREIEGIVLALFGAGPQFDAAIGRGLGVEREQFVGRRLHFGTVGRGRQAVARNRFERGFLAACRQHGERRESDGCAHHSSMPRRCFAAATCCLTRTGAVPP